VDLVSLNVCRCPPPPRIRSQAHPPRSRQSRLATFPPTLPACRCSLARLPYSPYLYRFIGWFPAIRTPPPAPPPFPTFSAPHPPPRPLHKSQVSASYPAPPTRNMLSTLPCGCPPAARGCGRRRWPEVQPAPFPDGPPAHSPSGDPMPSRLLILPAPAYRPPLPKDPSRATATNPSSQLAPSKVTHHRTTHHRTSFPMDSFRPPPRSTSKCTCPWVPFHLCPPFPPYSMRVYDPVPGLYFSPLWFLGDCDLFFYPHCLSPFSYPWISLQGRAPCTNMGSRRGMAPCALWKGPPPFFWPDGPASFLLPPTPTYPSLAPSLGLALPPSPVASGLRSMATCPGQGRHLCLAHRVGWAGCLCSPSAGALLLE